MARLRRARGGGKAPYRSTRTPSWGPNMSRRYRLGPRDATRGGVNGTAPPGQRGRESPLSIDADAVVGAEHVATLPPRTARRDARRGEWHGSAGPEGAGKPPIDRRGRRRGGRTCRDATA